MITYRKATIADIDTIAHFGQLLYSPDNTLDKLREEADEHLRSGTWAVFLALDGEAPVGLCEISLRNDYVEGTEGGTVGYIEGVFILPEYCSQHIAKELLVHGENWSWENGCAEIASDCVLDNTDSLRFHLKVGFTEASRNIHFVKKL
ncbi:MAG: GNAT family N-acetyltransferase [Oscillospiraceae bacterium]|nr:GNAT family N-acetyltransferase [Oscillospiraceae bacterium]